MQRVLKKGWFASLFIFVCILGFARDSFSTTVIIPSDYELIIGSRAIVIGRVLSTACAKDDQDRIHTYVTIRVLDSLKGDIDTRRIVLKEQGGQVNDSGSIVFGTPRFRVGEKVLLYLDTWPDGSLRVHEMFLGKFSIIVNAETGEQTAARSAPDTDLIVLNGHAPRGSEARRSTDRMELNDYIQMVREGVEITREQSDQYLATYYRDVPLLREPPEYAVLNNGGAMQPYYTFLSSSTPPRWFDQPVIFNVNTNQAPAGATEDVAAAMVPWSSISGCALRVSLGGTTGSCRPSPSENTIIFNNCDGRFAPPPGGGGCATILALGGCNWSSTTTVVSGTTFFRANSGFISFNPYAACEFSNHCNVQEITTHELGHALGLGHSADSSATMYYIAHFDGRCANIRPDDSAGMLFIYPCSGDGGVPLTITTGSQLQGGALSTPYSASLAASGGAAPYTWSLLGGSLPAGLSLGAGGSISGTPTTAGTSAFTIQVRDAQSATAQKDFSLTVGSSSNPIDSQFTTQTVPTNVQPSQSFQANIKWKNTGNETWGNGFRIVSKNPDYNTTWGGNTVPLSGLTVAPGQTLDLTFTAFAPSAAGNYNFQWQLFKDGGSGFFGQISTNAIIAVASLPAAPSIGGPSSVDATKGAAFSYQLTGSGGRAPYTWSISSGSPPAGVTLNTGGLLSGTPTVAGSFGITVQLTDADQRTAQKSLAINVTNPALAIATTSLPGVVRGFAYSQQLAASGGASPYVWTVSSGALPNGLILSSGTGVISGVPTIAGEFNFTATVTDSQQKTAAKQLTIKVDPSAPLLLESVPTVEVLKGSPVSYQLRASGGTPAYTWSLGSGSLPSGVSLNTTSGLISGNATGAGSFTAQVTVRDQGGQTATTSVQIRVIDPDTIPIIMRVKYKGARKLIVSGERFDALAVLLVDGRGLSSAQIEPGVFIVKPLALATGNHDVRVMNPSGAVSQSFVLSIQ